MVMLMILRFLYTCYADQLGSSGNASDLYSRGGLFNLRPVTDYPDSSFDVELRLSPPWVGGNIGSTDATKTCHILNAYIFEANNRKVINNTSLDSL
jgi:hypothetical protein